MSGYLTLSAGATAASITLTNTSIGTPYKVASTILISVITATALEILGGGSLPPLAAAPLGGLLALKCVSWIYGRGAQRIDYLFTVTQTVLCTLVLNQRTITLGVASATIGAVAADALTTAEQREPATPGKILFRVVKCLSLLWLTLKIYDFTINEHSLY